MIIELQLSKVMVKSTPLCEAAHKVPSKNQKSDSEADAFEMLRSSQSFQSVSFNVMSFYFSARSSEITSNFRNCNLISATTTEAEAPRFLAVNKCNFIAFLLEHEKSRKAASGRVKFTAAKTNSKRNKNKE